VSLVADAHDVVSVMVDAELGRQLSRLYNGTALSEEYKEIIANISFHKQVGSLGSLLEPKSRIQNTADCTRDDSFLVGHFLTYRPPRFRLHLLRMESGCLTTEE